MNLQISNPSDNVPVNNLQSSIRNLVDIAKKVLDKMNQVLSDQNDLIEENLKKISYMDSIFSLIVS